MCQAASGMARVLPASFFAAPSTAVAPTLLGQVLVRRLAAGELVRARIVETEAYGPGDPACHAYKKRTRRNTSMFGPPGQVYVYLIYGMYHCLNLVTEDEGVGSAVLIRAVELPANGELRALRERDRARAGAGPGKLCKRLAIDRTLDGSQLRRGQALWVEEGAASHNIVTTTRIGISQGQDLPWRYYDTHSPSVSVRERSRTAKS